MKPDPHAWGWSAAFFARVFGLGERTAARMLSGARPIPPPILAALCAIQAARETAPRSGEPAAPREPDRAA